MIFWCDILKLSTEKINLLTDIGANLFKLNNNYYNLNMVTTFSITESPYIINMPIMAI